MAFDGNGNWISNFSAVADRDANIKILASRFDNIFIADIAQSFEDCLTKDMQVKPQQAFDANSYKVINVANPTNDNDAVNKYTLDSSVHDFGSKTGMVMQFAGNVAPDGWLICDGSAISRTTYSNLFNVIGTTYGDGDGSTTFNIPNLIYRQLGTTSPVKGTGKSLGLFDGTTTGSLTTNAGANTLKVYDEYVDEDLPQTSSSGSLSSPNKVFGLTTDKDKSGVIADFTSLSTMNMIIKY